MSIFYLFLPINTTFMSSLSNSWTNAHPIPSVNPVMATQQSPYFYLSSLAEDFAWLILCCTKIFTMMVILFSKESPVRANVVAPAISKSFCQLDEIDLRKMDEKWLESSETRGILVANVSTRLMIGFLSKTFYKMLTAYSCAWVIRVDYYLD